MSRIKIKNFGPIKEGSTADNDIWIEIKKVTVFTGNQGSGKSTVAKLISTLTWIEKALVRGDLQNEAVLDYEGFREICGYQGIKNYFKENSEIEYIGDAMEFSLVDKEIVLTRTQNFSYNFPKIMYVPAERAIVGTIENYDNIKDLPGPLYTFAQEYDKALKDLKGGIHLPINDVNLSFDNLRKIPHISGTDYNIRLSEASSGFHSFIPAFIVTRYLSDWVNNQRKVSAHSNNISFNLEDENRLRQKIREIMDNSNLTEKIKRIQIEELSARSDYRAFINIIEEPEQNLHPKSQRETLNNLLKNNNLLRNNTLVMTTHSPYLINYITLAVKAGQIFSKKLDGDIFSELETIVPSSSTLLSEDLAIYEMDEKSGEISRLSNYNGIPSDTNILNEELDEFNSLYAQLVELQNKNR